MVKHINYPVLENTQTAYKTALQTLEEDSSRKSQTEDPMFSSAAQTLANAANSYIEYTKGYGSVRDWQYTQSNDDDFFQCLSNACTAYAVYEHRKTSADAELFNMMRAGLKSMKHNYNPPPMDMLSYPPLSDTLMNVYRHMSYTPIKDVIFLDMVAAYENACFSCAWNGCWAEPDDWYGECLCMNKYLYIDEIFEWRDFPTAITHMRQIFTGFEQINDVVFWDLGMIYTEYSEYTNDFDNWNDPKIAAFRDFSWFQQFVELPAELRGGVMHEYLLLERDTGRLSKHQHYDEFNNPCCKWEYPRVLIACDNQNTKVFPSANTGRCPKGWLPNLAFVSHQMHEEVLVLMLQRTERFDLKYMFRDTNFKIATWFSNFLKAIPGGGGNDAVKHLNFPHMHWFNHLRESPALTNPSLELAVICKNLRKLDMTFHFDKVTVCNEATNWNRQSRPLASVISHFKMETLFGCTSLQEVYIDGIYGRPSQGGDVKDLDVLEDLGKWMMRGFLVQRNAKHGIQVELVRRSGTWKGHVGGRLIMLDDTDMNEVKTRIEFKYAYAKALTVAGPAIII